MEDKVIKDNNSVKTIAWMLIVVMVVNIFSPTIVMAKNNVNYSDNISSVRILKKSSESVDVINSNIENNQVELQMPGSPDQPEVVSFTPMGTSDMVNPFTGDFSYNIPLLEVDGYPINIAYNAGITQGQESTWIGLGWNLNPGVVNRAMRGLPDDFNGTEQIEKSFNMKKDWTVGVGAGLGVELFGFGKKTGTDFENNVSLNASLGINYNSYNGFGADVSLTPSLSIAKKDKPEMNFSLGLSGSSTGGATISPNVSIKKETSTSGIFTNTTTTKSMAIGSSLNSRGGLGDITMNLSKQTKRSATALSRIFFPTYRPESSQGSVSASFNFGMSTYTPQISMPMNSFGVTFSFKAGTEIIGFTGTWDVKGYFHSQWLKENNQKRAAYGYLNLQNGQKSKMAMMDFNRENDGSFTRYTPALPIPNLTYDIFSVSGQGVGGSYRAYRPDLGYLFDPHESTTSVNASAGLELAVGVTAKNGVDISGTYSNSNSGVWNTMNNTDLQFNSTNIPFREANEMSVNQDLALYNAIGGAEPVRFVNNTHLSLKNTLETQDGTDLSGISNYNRVNKEKRNQVIYTLTHDQVKKGFGIESLHPQAYTGTSAAPIDHHIAQFTTLNTDGTRYVYGVAAYDLEQNDVSFAVGDKISGNGGLNEDCSNGLVSYTPNVDNTLNNDKGLDNYYNSVKTPAYAHSYLLTCVLNADYIDVDQIKGPSKGDVGGFVKFSYEKVDNYKWRNVVEKNKASFDEGLNSNLNDDKAHYTYGVKELWYVKRIETKNHVLLFYTSNRDDAPSIIDENGGLDNSKSMKKLDKIELYSLPEYEADPSTAVPLKTVHFEYDYSLCPNYPSNVNGGGKLTLKKVFFTHQKSQKGRYTPYVFEYGENPSYDLKSVDRWGNYKPRPTACGDIANDPLRPSDFPYVGYDKTETDLNVSAWNLSAINLPSGGRIEVEYESDDYAYVQHKKATQMFKIIGVQFQSGSNTSNIETSGAVSVSNDNIKNALLYFELIPGYDTPDKIGNYLNGIENIYFRALMKFDDGKFDFVPGYAELDGSFTPQIVTLANGTKAGCIKLKAQTLMDNGNAYYNPIAVAGIQFGRMQLSRLLPPGGNDIDDGMGLADLGNALVSAFKSYGEMFTGPNIPLYSAKFGTDLVIGKSWLRLNNPNEKKLGGGHRVKRIKMYDSWDVMTSGAMPSYYYGQEYDYTQQNGISSSGVAAYEPQIGGDENVWRQPVANDKKILLAPDIRNYQEMPFGEQFFPSPQVGYSRITIKDLSRTGVSRTATGKVVHEFYTSKDFPTIVKRTSPNIKRLKIPVFAYFFSLSIDEMSASQGFVVETNDMAGKPKSQMVYPEGQTDPITKVEYFYQSEPAVIEGISAKRLVNDVVTIQKDGTTSTNTIGLVFEGVADFRKSASNSISGSVQANINFTAPFIVAGSVIPSGSYERTSFRSSSFTKVIERFGVLENTKATDLGSIVETRTLAYDAETGGALLTETATNFNDKVYNFSYPAHWYYEGMGQAYKNIDFNKSFILGGPLQVVNGITSQLNAGHGFFVGDEVGYVTTSNSALIAWVVEVTPTQIKLMDKNGSLINASIVNLKLLRSGRKNMQNTPIGSIVLRSNPLSGLKTNIFENVLQAGAVEYTEDWNTFCECFLNNTNTVYTTNPYVLGLKGIYRPKASYVHLAGRTQAFVNNNSNVREDGMFTSFLPFYRMQNGLWNINKSNWTYTSSVVEFSPFGQAIETVDALNRFSSSVYGYNQSLPLAVAANTRYRQLGFDGFEDYNYDNCSDNHFRIGVNQEIVEKEAHTGRRSIKVSANNPVVFETLIVEECEDNACNMQISIEQKPLEKGQTDAQMTLSVSNGTPEYQIEYEVLQGESVMTTNENGSSWTFNGYGYGGMNELYNTVMIIIKDSKGCTFQQEIKF